MAHFAQLDENNVVTQVIVVANAELLDENGVESEQRGVEFCQSLFGADTVWKQTSYNRNMRKNYAGIGFTYREDLDAFVPPSPFPSWLLNEETAQWYAPVPYPDDGKMYHWDEATLSWIESAEVPA
jgi:hypothetical protein